MKLTLSMADTLIAAAKAAVVEYGFAPVAIAVLDSGGHQLAFARMDGTFLAAIDIALGKARTAVLFAATSEEVGAALHPNGPAYSLENSNGGLVGIAGGIPLRDAAGATLGSIGVSGATKEQDQMIARYAVDRFVLSE